MSIQQPSASVESVATKILDAAFVVHKELGPGLLESVYELCMADVLLSWGMVVDRQKPFPVMFRDKNIDTGFKADIVVNDSVIVELKCVEKLMPIHDAQLLTYLKLSNVNLGLLLNFNVPLMKHGIKRLVLSQTRSDRSVRCG